VKPIFVTGVARSGSNLVGRMLDAHPDITLAIDPYLILFRWFRNAVLKGRIDPSAPFQDGYFSDPSNLDALLAATWDRPFEPGDWASFRARTAIECPDLVATLDGPTFGAVLTEGLRRIESVRGAARWVGFKEVWIVDYFASLARSFPEARFVILNRDPRAILASLLAMAKKDPTQIAHALSYARHWRKTVAFGIHYASVLKGRLKVLRYEDLVERPEHTARGLCDFLDVSFDPKMLDTRAYFDHATGKPWSGNSSFEPTASGIVGARAERWRTSLEPAAVKMVEMVCGPEMKWCGYEFVTPPSPADEVRDYLVAHNSGAFSWRSDSGDAELEFAREVKRFGPLKDRAAIRQAYLFEDVYRRLHG
jgi:hypothetical protein